MFNADTTGPKCDLVQLTVFDIRPDLNSDLDSNQLSFLQGLLNYRHGNIRVIDNYQFLNFSDETDFKNWIGKDQSLTHEKIRSTFKSPFPSIYLITAPQHKYVSHNLVWKPLENLTDNEVPSFSEYMQLLVFTRTENVRYSLQYNMHAGEERVASVEVGVKRLENGDFEVDFKQDKNNPESTDTPHTSFEYTYPGDSYTPKYCLIHLITQFFIMNTNDETYSKETPANSGSSIAMKYYIKYSRVDSRFTTAYSFVPVPKKLSRLSTIITPNTKFWSTFKKTDTENDIHNWSMRSLIRTVGGTMIWSYRTDSHTSWETQDNAKALVFNLGDNSDVTIQDNTEQIISTDTDKTYGCLYAKGDIFHDRDPDSSTYMQCVKVTTPIPNCEFYGRANHCFTCRIGYFIDQFRRSGDRCYDTIDGCPYGNGYFKVPLFWVSNAYVMCPSCPLNCKECFNLDKQCDSCFHSSANLSTDAYNFNQCNCKDHCQVCIKTQCDLCESGYMRQLDPVPSSSLYFIKTDCILGNSCKSNFYLTYFHNPVSNEEESCCYERSLQPPIGYKGD